MLLCTLSNIACVWQCRACSTMRDADEALHARVRTSMHSAIYCVLEAGMSLNARCRCTPSADVLQRIHTFSSSVASILSAREQSPTTVQALRALSYVQTLAARLSGGNSMTLARCVMLVIDQYLLTRMSPKHSWHAAVIKDTVASLSGWLFVSRQKLMRLQEAAGTLTHSKSRSDPYATASRAPLGARTASTPVLYSSPSSAEVLSTANAVGREGLSHGASDDAAPPRQTAEVLTSPHSHSTFMDIVLCQPADLSCVRQIRATLKRSRWWRTLCRIVGASACQVMREQWYPAAARRTIRKRCLAEHLPTSAPLPACSARAPMWHNSSRQVAVVPHSW